MQRPKTLAWKITGYREIFMSEAQNKINIGSYFSDTKKQNINNSMMQQPFSLAVGLRGIGKKGTQGLPMTTTPLQEQNTWQNT
ncbi:MAG: hypothetical protein JEY79_04560 [Pseudodesulfovibrio sp.]|nr:hypothetical protein [Pseudodesulfovibrio sp.]